jgi:hypothetical protein
MLGDGTSWSAVQAATRCSRATVAKVAQRSIAKPVAGPNRYVAIFEASGFYDVLVTSPLRGSSASGVR